MNQHIPEPSSLPAAIDITCISSEIADCLKERKDGLIEALGMLHETDLRMIGNVEIDIIKSLFKEQILTYRETKAVCVGEYKDELQQMAEDYFDKGWLKYSLAVRCETPDQFEEVIISY
ncbi:MAG: hypothetical protein GY861_08930 [bacterium]|nr:hypothetical protein [bacterium]